MKEEFESPVYHVHRVPVEKVRANSYNPNHVAAPEMKLLELSIWDDPDSNVRVATIAKVRESSHGDGEEDGEDIKTDLENGDQNE